MDEVNEPFYFINAELLAEMLWRAHNGENPDLIVAEYHAGSVEGIAIQ